MTARHTRVAAALRDDRRGGGGLEFAATVLITLVAASALAHGFANDMSERIGAVVNLLGSVP